MLKVLLHTESQCVRELRNGRAPDVVDDLLVGFGVLGDLRDGLVHSLHELCAEARALRFVPVLRSFELRACGGDESDRMGQGVGTRTGGCRRRSAGRMIKTPRREVSPAPYIRSCDIP